MAGQPAPSSFPLSPPQLGELSRLATGLDPLQLQWTSGYLAGLAAAGAAVSEPPAGTAAADTSVATRLTILYGSQTGNGRAIAEALGESLEQAGRAVRLVDMADYRTAELAREQHLAVVVSTHGEGDPPDDAEALWEFLNGPKAPNLNQLNYSVLALGDSSYAQFCQTGRDFDQRLADLGGTRFSPLVECDLDYENPAVSWRREIETYAEGALDAPTVATTPPVLKVLPSVSRITRENPHPATLLVNQPIVGRGSDKDIRHLELDLEGSGLHYQPGDSLGIWPQNDAALVAEVAEWVGGPEVTITLDDEPLSIGEALTKRLELTLLSRSFLEAYARLTDDEVLSARLDPEQREALVAWMAERQVIDVLRESPPPGDAQGLADALRRLTPRLYSIASSLEANPDEAHLTVARVTYQAFDRKHAGAATDWLSRLEPGVTVPVYLAPNDRFRLPADGNAPVIMIGPGTGVAPFRAFLEQREVDAAPGRNWLFFGNPHFDSDFLYQLDWQRWLKRGVLDRLDVAFSRDQAEKIYVQDRLRERGAELWSWLEEGAYLYVCGDASQMAPDVHLALKDIAGAHGGLSGDEAEDYLKTLKRGGRYLKDTY